MHLFIFFCFVKYLPDGQHWMQYPYMQAFICIDTLVHWCIYIYIYSHYRVSLVLFAHIIAVNLFFFSSDKCPLWPCLSIRINHFNLMIVGAIVILHLFIMNSILLYFLFYAFAFVPFHLMPFPMHCIYIYIFVFPWRSKCLM